MRIAEILIHVLKRPKWITLFCKKTCGDGISSIFEARYIAITFQFVKTEGLDKCLTEFAFFRCLELEAEFVGTFAFVPNIEELGNCFDEIILVKRFTKGVEYFVSPTSESKCNHSGRSKVSCQSVRRFAQVVKLISEVK